MANLTESSLYFTLRPNQTCQISQKQPTVQNLKKKVHNICISLRPKTLFSNVSPLSCLMQLLLMYTQFGYLCNL